jgi:hypothetical protein
MYELFLMACGMTVVLSLVAVAFHGVPRRHARMA